ncbi:hypothetical protein BGZ95_000222 [Linnemannia exigua]|uniref:Uncharacterized protein n=1 Tax=Linnemannia exigua TaxID=604196 RepID=A0AAD4D8V7_9FUNG|nr:hypothetical protein BGZ95_000222 [Linnemannia exigua]
MAMSDINQHRHRHHHNNNDNNNSLPPHEVKIQNATPRQSMPQPLQAKTTSASTSSSIFASLSRATLKKVFKSPTYPAVHQHTNHPFQKTRPATTSHTTATGVITKKNTNAINNKGEYYLPVYKRNYKPSPETTILLLNDVSQLQQLYDSLLHSDNVGISLIRPLVKPWARSAVAWPLQKRQSQEQHESLKTKQKQKHKDGDGTGEGAEGRQGGEWEGRGGAFLQLACDSDKSIYVIDLEVFLDKSVDPEHKLPRLLGEIFFNPSICKLEPQYHMDNLLDFYDIWIARDYPSSSSSITTVAATALNHSAPQQPLPNQHQHQPKGPITSTGVYKVKAWCTEKPFLPTTMIQPRFRNISGLLYRILGRFLRRTSRLGWDAWTIRPLPECLQTDLAMSAQCLLDMYAVLDKDGAKRDRDGTAEFKIQPSRANF